MIVSWCTYCFTNQLYWLPNGPVEEKLPLLNISRGGTHLNLRLPPKPSSYAKVKSSFVHHSISEIGITNGVSAAVAWFREWRQLKSTFQEIILSLLPGPFEGRRRRGLIEHTDYAYVDIHHNAVIFPIQPHGLRV